MNLKDKIIAFDIDGTLARGDSNPSEYSFEVLKTIFLLKNTSIDKVINSAIKVANAAPIAP